MRFVLRDSTTKFVIRNKTGFDLSGPIPVPTGIYNDKGYVSVADQIEKEVERLRKVAKYKTHEDQQSDLPWSVVRIDETRMIIKPGKRLDR